jgi:hypothetical protein
MDTDQLTPSSKTATADMDQLTLQTERPIRINGICETKWQRTPPLKSVNWPVGSPCTCDVSQKLSPDIGKSMDILLP